VQYYSRGTQATTQQVGFNVRVKNASDASVALSDVTIRYYFTADADLEDLAFACDHAANPEPPKGCTNVVATFGTVSSPDAKYYVEIGFKPAAGSLAAGAVSGVVQARFNTANAGNFESFTQAEHYSFDGELTSFTAAPNVTGYLDGVLAWGVEP
jgi:hypothetical protein